MTRNQLITLLDRKRKSESLSPEDLNGKYKKAYEELNKELLAAAGEYVSEFVCKYTRADNLNFTELEEYKEAIKEIKQAKEIDQIDIAAARIVGMITILGGDQ